MRSDGPKTGNETLELVQPICITEAFFVNHYLEEVKYSISCAYNRHIKPRGFFYFIYSQGQIVLFPVVYSTGYPQSPALYGF